MELNGAAGRLPSEEIEVDCCCWSESVLDWMDGNRSGARKGADREDDCDNEEEPHDGGKSSDIAEDADRSRGAGRDKSTSMVACSVREVRASRARRLLCVKS